MVNVMSCITRIIEVMKGTGQAPAVGEEVHQPPPAAAVEEPRVIRKVSKEALERRAEKDKAVKAAKDKRAKRDKRRVEREADPVKMEKHMISMENLRRWKENKKDMDELWDSL